MAQMTAAELTNWAALYIATSLCCAIAMGLSLALLGVQLHRERPWRGVATYRAAALLLPQTWWRWQKLYLRSTPVTLAIVGLFAFSLRWP